MFMRRSVAAPVLAVAVLAGCSTAARDGMISPQPAVGSRMAARPMAGDLLYLSDVKTDVVYVYSYPQGKLVGTLADFVAPRGECASASGNVWIVDSGTYAVLEYTHGGTSAITALNIEGVPAGCSVDPLTNNVAVTSRGTSVTVTVFRHAHHKWEPFHFRDPQMRPVFCGYDAKGNLFVDGLGKGNVFRLDELVRGGSMLASVAVSQSIKAPGQVQWDGTDLAIGDAGVAPSVVYRFSEGTGGLTERARPRSAARPACDNLGSRVRRLLGRITAKTSAFGITPRAVRHPRCCAPFTATARRSASRIHPGSKKRK